MSEVQHHHRPVRSYVLREGRMTSAQQRALEQQWPRFGVDWIPGRRLNLPVLFGNTNPIFLEIGFGNGEALCELASRNPLRNYLGIEVHRPGVGHLLLQVCEREITNLRVCRHDAVEILANGLAPGSLAGVYLFFPDPWPKQRHQKRRILTPELVRQLARVIRPGGVFHAATDWEPYAQQMLERLTAEPGLFENAAGPGAFSPRPRQRPLTRFEQRGVRLGNQARDLIFYRR
jgi:tRNA (guanine-N7-)-methyltransferase